MATIAENVLDLAMLVKDIKRKTQLSETTIMRVVDMTFALAQQNQTSPGFPFEIPGEETPEEEDFGNVIEFPTATNPEDTEA